MPDSVQAIMLGDRGSAARRSVAADRRLQRPGIASRISKRVLGATVSVLVTLAGCGVPAPKDFGGSWTPVNRFQSAPTEIPLSPAYTFYGSPMDGTLRTMLKRWATDNGLQLSYQLGSDFTLYQPVAKVRTNDLQSAVGELSAIYAPQGVSVTADSKRIVVQSTGVAQATTGSN